MQRRLAAILAADVVGFSRLTEEDEEGTLSRLESARTRIVNPSVAKLGGRVVKLIGDGALIEFPSVVDAVRCAIEIQLQMQRENATRPAAARIDFRIGVNLGDVIVQGDDLYGDGVNVASRLEELAEPGGIWISRSVHEQIELKISAPFEATGTQSLKNISRQVDTWRWTGADHQDDKPEHAAARPSQASDRSPPNNLPRQLSSFVGRTREISDIHMLLAETRLLTLTGAGGCGKTRLACQAALDVVSSFPDGVWFVSLASLSDPAQLAQTVATVLGVREQPGHSLADTIEETLASKSMLLILDNCEHVLLECARLSEDLLRACPDLKIIATSREALGVSGELVQVVPGLAVPQSRTRYSSDEMTSFEAVQLFADRARLRNRAFELTSENVTAVTNICARLDGIPLAIELSAARVRVLSVRQIAERLDDAFKLLTEGSRTGLSHHQTLRMAMDWSYSLLSAEESSLFRRLSVFAGGFSLDAVEAICTAERDDCLDALDLLHHLVEKSTVVAEDHGAVTRYRLLETLRQFGHEKLDEAGEWTSMRRGHMNYFLALAAAAEPNIQGSGRDRSQAEWLDRLETDHDNLRIALKYGEAEGDGSFAVALAGALWRFWEVRGYLSEGLEALRNALAAGSDAAPADRAKALDGAGRLAWRQGDFPDAHAYFTESLALWRRTGDASGEANSLHGLARAALNLGDYSAARRSAEASLSIQREIQNEQGIASAINTLGEVARVERDLVRAESLYRESLAIFRSIGDTAASVSVLHNLGYTALNNAETGAAAEIFCEALCIARDLKDRLGVFSMLGGLACVASEAGQPERAVELFGAADSAGKAWGYAGDRVDQDEVECRLARVRAALEEETFNPAWARGQALEPEAAIARALDSANQI